jgi:hypothetical protein
VGFSIFYETCAGMLLVTRYWRGRIATARSRMYVFSRPIQRGNSKRLKVLAYTPEEHRRVVLDVR